MPKISKQKYGKWSSKSLASFCESKDSHFAKNLELSLHSIVCCYVGTLRLVKCLNTFVQLIKISLFVGLGEPDEPLTIRFGYITRKIVKSFRQSKVFGPLETTTSKMWFYVLAILVGFVGASYLYVRQKYSYFRSKGITEEPGTKNI